MTHCDDHTHAQPKTCRVCKSTYCHDCHPSYFGICEKCSYKILIVLVVIMVIASYMAWFGVVL